MASLPLTAGDGLVLDIVTVCKADHWVEEILPRFAGLVDSNCSGVVRRHLRLVTDPSMTAAEEGRLVGALLDRGWHTVVCHPLDDPHPGRRLLAFDAVRAGLLGAFGLREALYMDPDTDVVADLQGIQRLAPDADLLWVANPMLLEPVLADLERHGFTPAGTPGHPVLMEPGFFYLRRDMSDAFATACSRCPDVNDFVPGSTYWNMVMLALGPKAVRLPDAFNRTFWDVSAAVATARSVHFTGQWKRLQPHIEYDRPGRRIIVRPERVQAAARSVPAMPDALTVVAMFRDDASYLPHALDRFESWERAGLALRYFFLENDSVDATPSILSRFMKSRPGRLEQRKLAIPYRRSRDGQHRDRIMPLARMRNFIVDIAAAAAPRGDREWMLLLDSDIFFPEDILDRIFAAWASDRVPESIGMLTCYTQQLFRADNIPGAAVDCPDMPGWSIADHYFDTFAFQDADHRHHHPFCGFARCRRCRPPGSQPYPLPLIPADRPIVDVAAAFGGLALLPADILRDPRIRWTTYGCGFEQQRVLAEHVIFCDRLRTLTGRRIVVLQDVDCVYRL